LLGSAGLPEPIVTKTYAAVREAMQDQQVIQYVNGTGSESLVLSLEEFQKAYREELDVVVPLIRELGIVPQ
jgi:tripartite-type tricarboxylate transporter receptor subunit TctC